MATIISRTIFWYFLFEYISHLTDTIDSSLQTKENPRDTQTKRMNFDVTDFWKMMFICRRSSVGRRFTLILHVPRKWSNKRKDTINIRDNI